MLSEQFSFSPNNYLNNNMLLIIINITIIHLFMSFHILLIIKLSFSFHHSVQNVPFSSLYYRLIKLQSKI